MVSSYLCKTHPLILFLYSFQYIVSLCDPIWLLKLQPSHPHSSQQSRGDEKEKGTSHFKDTFKESSTLLHLMSYLLELSQIAIPTHKIG